MKNTFNKDFTLFLIGQGMSSFGTLIQKYCVSLFVLSITDSSMIFATVMILSSIPNIFIGPFGGVLGDSLDKRKIMISLDVISGTLLLLSFALFRYTGINLWVLFVLITVLSIINALYIPSANSAIPFLVEGDIVKANSLNTFIITLTNVLAPIISGFLIGFVSLEWIIIGNGLTFIISALLEYIMKLNEKEVSKEKLSIKSAVEDLKQGLNFSLKDEKIKNIVLCSFLCNMIVMPIYTVTIPYLSKKICGFSNVQYGVIETAIMIGLLVGALLINVLNKKVKLGDILSSSIFIIGTFIMILGAIVYLQKINVISELNIFFILFCTVCLFVGAFISVMSISLTSLLQTNVDKGMLARANSIVISLSTIATPLGQLVVGAVSEVINCELLLVIMSVLMAAISVLNKRKIYL